MLDIAIFILAGMNMGYVIRLIQEDIEDRKESAYDLNTHSVN
jgi:hypothetical protein